VLTPAGEISLEVLEPMLICWLFDGCEHDADWIPLLNLSFAQASENLLPNEDSLVGSNDSSELT